MNTKLKLPDRIKVGPYQFFVREHDHAWLQETGMYGSCHVGTLTIDVVTTVDPIMVLDSLIHEIYHAIYHTFDIEDADNEEKTVTLLSTGFTGVLMDNPKLGTLINKVRKLQRKE